MRISEVYVIDTHALLWFFTADARLSLQVRELLLVAERGEFEIVIPMIVMAEALAVIEKGRSPLAIDDLLARVQGLPTFSVAAFDMDVFREMLNLPKELELHDRAIAATARVYGAKAAQPRPGVEPGGRGGVVNNRNVGPMEARLQQLETELGRRGAER